MNPAERFHRTFMPSANGVRCIGYARRRMGRGGRYVCDSVNCIYSSITNFLWILRDFRNHSLTFCSLIFSPSSSPYLVFHSHTLYFNQFCGGAPLIFTGQLSHNFSGVSAVDVVPSPRSLVSSVWSSWCYWNADTRRAQLSQVFLIRNLLFLLSVSGLFLSFLISFALFVTVNMVFYSLCEWCVSLPYVIAFSAVMLQREGSVPVALKCVFTIAKNYSGMNPHGHVLFPPSVAARGVMDPMY